ncbi:FAD/NAD(P)-binding domain-containing protein [Lophiostoma macrostomum CBS 122681]|uniref:FAD/NAD(P)-binding domain-containing protein n=1 Tax=Lophiostoma macrostomum CBS 122681 TaxID=1314788 RepID=A0A6A6SYK2_9PLEO|nr:FAD/NAD(P)-binding domain-containing protein [Lophiostoma macrostomum CBS 122681]
MSNEHAIIIGGGIAGLAVALALKRHSGIKCSVFEIRTEPATIGGAVNLTPNALRYLEHLGVLPKLEGKGCDVKSFDLISHRTGKPLGKVNFDNIDRFKYRAMRILRNELHHSLLETLENLEVDINYGMKIRSVKEEKEGVTANFEDGSTVTGDFLLGCDGIHSAVRMKFVEPDRKPEYTGISVAYGFLDATHLRERLPVEATSLIVGSSGILLMTYADAPKTNLYIAAVTSVDDVGSREGWVAKGQDKVAIKNDLERRFSGPTIPCWKEVIEKLDAPVFFPIYRLFESDKWASGRILLLGDAAHAMPPQGESVGFALEDAVLFSRIVQNYKPSERFQKYEALRQGPVSDALKAANRGAQTVGDHGWLMTIFIEWATWIYLLLRASKKEEEFAYDVREIELDSK